jgi:hypothetical protein
MDNVADDWFVARFSQLNCCCMHAVYFKHSWEWYPVKKSNLGGILMIAITSIQLLKTKTQACAPPKKKQFGFLMGEAFLSARVGIHRGKRHVFSFRYRMWSKAEHAFFPSSRYEYYSACKLACEKERHKQDSLLCRMCVAAGLCATCLCMGRLHRQSIIIEASGCF